MAGRVWLRVSLLAPLVLQAEVEVEECLVKFSVKTKVRFGEILKVSSEACCSHAPFE